MASGDTSITVVNNSLRLIGANTITSFSDGSKTSGIAENLYGFVKKHTLSMYPWKFAMKKVQLAEASGSPVNEWEKHYTMPSDSVSGLPNAVFFSGQSNAHTQLDFEIYEGKLLTNSATDYIEYVYTITEDLMTTYFISLLVYQLAWH